LINSINVTAVSDLTEDHDINAGEARVTLHELINERVQAALDVERHS